MPRVIGARLLPSLALLATLTAVTYAPAAGSPESTPARSVMLHTRPAAAPPPDATAAGAAAARWLAGQLVDGGLPGFAGTDWGLTIDALLALQAVGTEPAAVVEIREALAARADEYAAFRTDAGDYVTGGATAKVLVAAVVTGEDPTAFGGHDWRARVLDLVYGPDEGARAGWLFDRRLDDATGANMFDQSLAVIGLARSGGVPQSMVDFLVSQQCPEGGFRLYPSETGTPCVDEPPDRRVVDVDTTAYAVQALLAAAAAGASGTDGPIARATDWLLSVQGDDGSFAGSVLTAYPNTNSTGLAAQALAAVGETAAAARAVDYVLGLQLTEMTAGAAAEHVGAVAYTLDAYAAAVANGIAALGLDQWRRATAQAILGLAQVPLGEIGAGTGSPPPSPGPQPTSAPTPTPTPTVGPTGTPTPEPTGDGPGPSAEPTTPEPSQPSTTASPSQPVASPGAGSLPITGVSLVAYGLLGGGSMAVGAALLVFTRRRRVTTS